MSDSILVFGARSAVGSLLVKDPLRGSRVGSLVLQLAWSIAKSRVVQHPAGLLHNWPDDGQTVS